MITATAKKGKNGYYAVHLIVHLNENLKNHYYSKYDLLDRKTALKYAMLFKADAERTGTIPRMD